MDWTFWIERFGYFALYVGTALEGETVLLIGAWLVKQHLMNIWMVIAVATFGAFTGDQLFFRLGAKKGRSMIQSRPNWIEKSNKITMHLHKHRHWLMAGFRIVPGTRILVPVILGASGIRQREFALFNFFGCTAWATLVTLFGLIFAEFLKQLRPLHSDAEWIAYIVVFLVTITTVLFNLLNYHHHRKWEGRLAVHKIVKRRKTPKIDSINHI